MTAGKILSPPANHSQPPAVSPGPRIGSASQAAAIPYSTAAAMLETIFLYSAIGGGAVLLTQLAMMLLGMDDGFGEAADAGGVDVGDAGDASPDGATDEVGFWFLEMISLRTLAAAATFFGLVGGAANATGQSPGVSIVLACLAGYAAMYCVYWAFRQIFRFETSGNEDIYGAIGSPAQVYVPIGPANESLGKVHLALQGRTVEYQAVTDHGERLATGDKVLVTDVVSSDTVRVAPIGAVDLNDTQPYRAGA